MIFSHSNLRVLVTRPSPQGESLCAFLESHGLRPIFLPLIDIKPLESSLLCQQIAHLDAYDWAIFVSRPAVTTSAPWIHQQWPQLPPALHIAAIGEGTANALQQAGLPVDLCPPEWNSESLLALPAFKAMSGQRIAIFCGKGGRELLAATLKARDARVTLIMSYQRLLPRVDITPYLAMLKQHEIDIIIITSAQSLQHLQVLFDTSELLKKTPLVLVSERIMTQAKAEGFEHCMLAKDASHHNILQAIRSTYSV